MADLLVEPQAAVLQQLWLTMATAGNSPNSSALVWIALVVNTSVAEVAPWRMRGLHRLFN